MKIISLNLNGIRSAARHGAAEYLASQQADFVCVQEVRAGPDQVPAEMLAPGLGQAWFHHAQKPGYAGVGIYTRHAPDRVVEGLGWPDFDAEGRYLQVDCGRLSVVSLYLPSGSSSPVRQLAKFDFMERFAHRLREMRGAGREWILCGDWNIAHRAIDLKNWRSNQKNSGFLPEERAWLDVVFGDMGFVDAFRLLHPDATDTCYTWWSNRGQARAKNVGWRIDYQIVSPGIATQVRRAQVHPQPRYSDHAPLVVEYDYAP